MPKAILTEMEPEPCSICGEELYEGDPYKLELGDKCFYLCESCKPGVVVILQAAGVEVEQRQKQAKEQASFWEG